MSFKILLKVVKQIIEIGNKTKFNKEISLVKVVLYKVHGIFKEVGRLFAGETKK